jgi:hypothetical protein
VCTTYRFSAARNQALLFGKSVCLLLLVFASFPGVAQNDKLGTWNIVNVQYHLNRKWNAFFEHQLRSQKKFDDFFYHELKWGVGYNVTDKLSVLVGNGFYRTYSIGGNFKSPITSSEYRLWQQAVLTNNINRVKIEHRYRAEQRWFTDGFRNRFRYRANAIFPLNKPSIQKGVLFASAFNEVFLTDKSPYFLRNRFFAGIGYQFSKPFTLQTGFVRQADNNGQRMNGKSFIQTSLLFNFRNHNAEREQHPSAID